jgi:phage FluMu protein Com
MQRREQGATSAAGECRCECGSLIARLVEGGVELKCRRCKRTLVVPLTEQPDTSAAIRPTPAVRAAG